MVISPTMTRDLRNKTQDHAQIVYIQLAAPLYVTRNGPIEFQEDSNIPKLKGALYDIEILKNKRTLSNQKLYQATFAVN